MTEPTIAVSKSNIRGSIDLLTPIVDSVPPQRGGRLARGVLKLCGLCVLCG